MTALYLNPVFKAPSVHKYDTEDYRHVDPQFGGDGGVAAFATQYAAAGECGWCWTACLTTVAIPMPWFDRHNRGTGGACHNPESPRRDWYSFSDDGTALDWLSYASLPKLDYQSESLVNEIYRGEDSIVRHWLKAPWNMDGWRLDVVHMLGEAGGARNNMQHVAGITEAAKETQPEAYIVGEHFGRCTAMVTGRCGRCRHELSWLHIPVVGISCQYRYLLRSAAN